MSAYSHYGNRGGARTDFTQNMTNDQKDGAFGLGIVWRLRLCGLLRMTYFTNRLTEALRLRRNTGLRKIRIHGVVQLLLSILAIGSGIAVLVVASDNVAYPTFNFGPVIVGLVFLFGGILGWQASRKGMKESSQDTPSPSVKCYVCGHFAVCVTCVSLAAVSSAFSLIAAGVCFDPDEVISHNRRGEEVNLSEACEPNKTGNAIAGLVAGIVCLLIAFWSIFGTCFFCCYGRSFGFTNRRRQMRIMEQRIAQLEMQGRPPPAYSTNQPAYSTNQPAYSTGQQYDVYSKS